MLKTVQVGFNTSDLVGSMKLYSEAFGFDSAGSYCIWGTSIRPQDLKPDARAMMWWLTGSSDFFQLEFFQHAVPVPRPMRADWRPCDLGWVRIGVLVDDFAACLEALTRNGVTELSRVRTARGVHRVVFRDPYTRIMVEVIEQGEGRIGRNLVPGLRAPALVYATQSVSDLEASRRFYERGFLVECTGDECLHDDEDETLWGLEGAQRESLVVKGGEMLLEIVRYETPKGRPRRPDYKICDQGIANVAFGSHDIGEIVAALARLEAMGLHTPYFLRGEEAGAAYINDPEREVELLAAPKHLLPTLGFGKAAPFPG